MKIKTIILSLIVMVFVTSCTDVMVFNVVTPPDIIVNVNNAGDAKITTPASGKCKVVNQGKNGCLHFGKGETGLINFKRTGPPSWAFNSLRICKGDACEPESNLNIWERIEFAVADGSGKAMLIPDSSGTVDLTQLADSEDAFILLNQNTFAQEYYYSVDVCPSDGGDCSTADPPIENGGKH